MTDGLSVAPVEAGIEALDGLSDRLQQADVSTSGSGYIAILTLAACRSSPSLTTVGVLQADTRSEVRAMPQRRHGVHSGRRASKPSRKEAKPRSIRWFRAIGQDAHCASMPSTIGCLLQRSVRCLSTNCCLQGVLKALNVNKLTRSGVTFKFWSVLTSKE